MPRFADPQELLEMFLGNRIWKKTLKPEPHWSYANTHPHFHKQIFKSVETCLWEKAKLFVGY